MASGRPTITMLVSPYLALTSTSPGYASMPLTAAEPTLANRGEVLTETRERRNQHDRDLRP